MEKLFTTQWKQRCRCTILVVLSVAAGLSARAYNKQQVLDREITVHVRDVSFDTVLAEIGRAADVAFAYSPEVVFVQERITLDVHKKTVREVLNTLFAPHRINFQVHPNGKVISLKRNPARVGDLNYHHPATDPVVTPEPGLLTGTVTDIRQQPLVGVNIVVKGTTNGTTTDVAGRYTLQVEAGDVVVFSFIGYAPQELPVAEHTVLDVTLLEDATSLDAVVVNAGYWQVTEKESTGNISRITAKEIQNQPVNNVMASLAGRLPGVYVQQTTGVPGGAFTIQIRGRNSLRPDGNAPLYIIDGVPFTSTSLAEPRTSSILRGGSPLAAINPADIASIELLKDADATAIYGSRGANGVVLITTKKGRAGDTRVEINTTQGVGHVSKFMSMLTTPQYVEMRKEAFRNEGYWPLPAWLKFAAVDILEYDTTRYTDWQRELIGGTARLSNTSVSVSGGNAQTNFLFGGTHYRETTVYPGDFGFQRRAVNFSMNHSSPNNRLRLSVAANYSLSTHTLIDDDLTRSAITLPPNFPSLFDSEGDINWNWKGTFFLNPAVTLRRDYQTATQNLVANTTLTYQLYPDLHLRTALGYTSMRMQENTEYPFRAVNPAYFAFYNASAVFADAGIHTWIAEPQLDYSKSVGRGVFKFLLGASLQETVQNNQTLYASGFTSDALLGNIRAATDVDVWNASTSTYRYMALFARVNYTWHDRYIVNLTARRDGSSRFGPGKRFGNFGALGAAWIFSEEAFMRDRVAALSFGKLRVSYGSTGSDAIGNYQYLNSFSATTYPYNGSPGLTVTRHANENYSWETNTKFEAALESGWLKDKLHVSVSWFNNRSSSQLVGLPLPVMTGQPTVQFNFPATVENTGWEFALTTRNITRTSFAWTTSFNLTIPQNRLIAFPNLDAFPAYRNTYRVGESMFRRRTLQLQGVDPQTGYYSFTDANGDGRISTVSDGLFLKKSGQNYFGGINNNLHYKGFELDLFFQFVNQTGIGYMSSFASPGNMSNQPAHVVQRWQQPGDVTDVQRYALIGTGDVAYVRNLSSDNNIVNASFVRLKNLAFSWTLPDKWVRSAHLQKFRVYLQGQNLATWTPYIGLDPETLNSNALPPLRTFAVGLNVTL